LPGLPIASYATAWQTATSVQELLIKLWNCHKLN